MDREEDSAFFCLTALRCHPSPELEFGIARLMVCGRLDVWRGGMATSRSFSLVNSIPIGSPKAQLPASLKNMQYVMRFVISMLRKCDELMPYNEQMSKGRGCGHA